MGYHEGWAVCPPLLPLLSAEATGGPALPSLQVIWQSDLHTLEYATHVVYTWSRVHVHTDQSYPYNVQLVIGCNKQWNMSIVCRSCLQNHCDGEIPAL